MPTLNRRTSVVVCTDLSGGELHRQVGVDRVMTSGSLDGVMASIVVCSDLSRRETHRQLDVDRVMISGQLCGEIISILAQNVRDEGSIPALGEFFSIFITPPRPHPLRGH